MSKTTVKVEIPVSKPADLVTLAENVLKMHQSLGTASPLSGVDMVTFEKSLTGGKDKRAEAKRLHNAAEKLNQEAGVCLGIDKSQNTKTIGTVYSTLTSVRDVLLAINRGQEKKLTEWGFDVLISDVVRNGKKGGK